MPKPIVFLSHSSQDKAALAALKAILDTRAAGSLEFFLSSDGESIPLGRNWVVRVSDALDRAELMFIFLSQKSANSKWIHFEAGCAYAKKIQVVPVCLPGMDLERIMPPLSLLQGFNLHSYEAMGNLARLCNEKFQMKIDEKFNLVDFENFTRELKEVDGGFFGEFAIFINEIYLIQKNKTLSTNDYNPILALKEICDKSEINSHVKSESLKQKKPNSEVTFYSHFEIPGCEIKYKVLNERDFSISINLSPELFHLNAPLIDTWLKSEPKLSDFEAHIRFVNKLTGESNRVRVTAKLHPFGIKSVSTNLMDGFEFEGFKFFFYADTSNVNFNFKPDSNLGDMRLASVIQRLFNSQVLRENIPSFAEMIE